MSGTAKRQCWLVHGGRLNWDNLSGSWRSPQGHLDGMFSVTAACHMASWMNPKPTSADFCALCRPCCGTQEGSGGRNCSHHPCLICSYMYVNIFDGTFIYIDLGGSFIYISLRSSPNKSRITTVSILSGQGFEIYFFFLRKSSLWKYCFARDWVFPWGHQLHHCGRSELTAWNGLHSGDWLGRELPRRQIQPKLKIQLWRLGEIYFYEKHEHFLTDFSVVIF